LIFAGFGSDSIIPADIQSWNNDLREGKVRTVTESAEDNLLLVDDEPGVIQSLLRVMQDEPYRIHTASEAREGLRVLEQHSVKVVVSDHRMPGMSGSDLLEEVRKRYPNMIRVMLTGQASVDAATRCINNGEIYRFIEKPWDDTEFRLVIRSAMNKYNVEESIRRLIMRDFGALFEIYRRIDPGATLLPQCETCGRTDGNSPVYCAEGCIVDQELCEKCETRLSANWNVCPYCGTPARERYAQL